jgi:beta-glucosidase-like glycosyl hydrolase
LPRQAWDKRKDKNSIEERRFIQVDEAFKTAYRVLFRAGLFDPPEAVPWTRIGLDEYGSAEHRALAHELTLQSMVLLENTNNTLPLKRGGLKLAVLGPQANNKGGVYTGAAKGGETGSYGGLCGGVFLLKTIRKENGMRFVLSGRGNVAKTKLRTEIGS